MESSIRQAGNTRLLRYRPLTTLTVAMLFLIALGVILAGDAHAQETDSGGDFVDGEIVAKLDLAKLNPGETCRAAIDGVNNRNGTTIKEAFLENRNVACIYLLQAPAGSDTEQVADSIAADEKVRGKGYAEPNFTIEAPESEKHRHRGYPGSDPSQPSSGGTRYDSQYATGALRLGKAHNVNQGAGSTVAVLDTGVQSDHPELSGSVVDGESFVNESTTTEDTGNNLDDDVDGEIDEMVGHGTHVAGIVHLAAPKAEIMPLRVLDSDGNGNVYLIAEALQYAVDPDRNPRTNDGVDVVNMSFGSSRKSNLIRDVSDDLRANDDDDDGGDDDDGDDGGSTGPALRGVPVKGAVVVGSVGNDSKEQRRFPAAEANVIGVASVNGDKRKSGFSNYGRRWVDVSAPGTDVYSLFPDDQYAEWSGTSMAAPFVSGQAALIRSIRPSLRSTPAPQKPSVTKFIKNNAYKLNAGKYAGKLGAGHANVYGSVKAAKGRR